MQERKCDQENEDCKKFWVLAICSTVIGIKSASLRWLFMTSLIRKRTLWLGFAVLFKLRVL